MKKLIVLTAAFFVFHFANAASPGNKKIFVNGLFINDYLMAPTPDNGYFLVSHSVHWQSIVRLNSQYQTLWVKTVTNPYPNDLTLHDAGVLADSSFYVIYGALGDPVPSLFGLGGYYSMYLVMKINTQGNVVWTDEFSFSNTASYPRMGSARPLPDGGLIFAPCHETTALRLDANGTLTSGYCVSTGKSEDDHSCLDAEPTNDGGMVIITREAVNFFDPRSSVIRLNSNGSTAWTLNFAAGAYHNPNSIITTSDGNYLIGGLLTEGALDTYEGNTAWLTKVTPSGSVLWSKRYKSVVSAAAKSYLREFMRLTENKDGTITASGYSYEPYNHPDFQVIVTLDPNGEPLTAHAFPTVVQGCYGYNDPKLSKTFDGETRMHALEKDGYYSKTLLIDPAQLGDYCKAFPVSITPSDLTWTIKPTNSALRLKALPVLSHPAITLTGSAVTFSAEDLCGMITGITETAAESEGLALYPNPASPNDMVVMKSVNKVERILLHDISGRVVKQITGAGTGVVSFSASGLLPGVYFAEALDAMNEKVGVRKLIVAE